MKSGHRGAGEVRLDHGGDQGRRRPAGADATGVQRVAPRVELRAIQSAQRCIARGVPVYEVEGPAARAPESHAGGEASALRRAVAALGVQS